MILNARNFSAWLIAKLLIMSGFVRSATKKAMDGEYILSIYFHKPSKKEFESCIRWFQKNNFHFLSLSDIDRIIYEGLPFPKGGVLLTVDDGWQSNETNIIEVANQYHVPVAIFVSTSPVEEGCYWWSYWLHDKDSTSNKKSAIAALKKVTNEERLQRLEEMKKTVLIPRETLTVEQIRKAAHSEYITFGGHTHTHPILINCDEAQARSEFQTSKEKLEHWTGKEVNYVAYPNGDYGVREMRILHETGCRVAFCSEPSYLTSNRLKNRYNLPRFGYLEGASFAENICRMAGVWKSSVKWLKSKSLENKPFETSYPVLSKDNVTTISEAQI